MPVCNLLLRQQISRLAHSSFPTDLALPDRSADPGGFNLAIASAGVGVRAVCAIPRMSNVGGYPGSAGNVANIVCCALAVLLGVSLALTAGSRQAAVARREMQAFFIIFALQNVFQMLDTGKLISASFGRFSFPWPPLTFSTEKRQTWLDADSFLNLFQAHLLHKIQLAYHG